MQFSPQKRRQCESRLHEQSCGRFFHDSLNVGLAKRRLRSMVCKHSNRLIVCIGPGHRSTTWHRHGQRISNAFIAVESFIRSCSISPASGAVRYSLNRRFPKYRPKEAKFLNATVLGIVCMRSASDCWQPKAHASSQLRLVPLKLVQGAGAAGLST